MLANTCRTYSRFRHLLLPAIDTFSLAVIIPARNEADTLPQTLPQLISALQCFPYPSKIFVVDDGSTDGTDAVANSYGIEVIPGEGKGPGAARNLGANEALKWMRSHRQLDSNGWILFLDADCRPATDHFVRVLPHLRDPQNHLIAIQETPHLLNWFQKLGSRIKRAHQLWVAQNFSIPIVHAGCLYVRALSFESVGGFNHEHLFEDIDLGFRFSEDSIRILTEPGVTEVSDRRLQRVGLWPSLVTPARCAAVMFISRQLVLDKVSQFFLKVFKRMGSSQLPILLWWHDPEKQLKGNILSATLIMLLWWCMFALMKLGFMKRKPRLPNLLSPGQKL